MRIRDWARAERGSAAQVAVVLPLLVFLVLAGAAFVQRIQVGQAVEAAAREAARYVAANCVFDGTAVAIPGHVRVEAERRAREIVARNVNQAARGAPGGAQYFNIDVSVVPGWTGPGGSWRPDYVAATVRCTFYSAASVRPGSAPQGALGPGRQWTVSETAVFRVPGYASVEGPPSQ